MSTSRRVGTSRGSENFLLGNNSDLWQNHNSWHKILSPNSKTVRSKTNSYRGFNGQYTDLAIPSHYEQKPNGSSWQPSKLETRSGKDNFGIDKASGKEEMWRKGGGEEETVKEEEAIYSTIRTR